ncbi:MAG TPA: hypothetical protein VJP02_31615 [Candidatus Sulfotelmatobacter sp.]|nr:hypothetical protein [Candidatus Sulfotelmatobacter sp.]
MQEVGIFLKDAPVYDGTWGVTGHVQHFDIGPSYGHTYCELRAAEPWHYNIRQQQIPSGTILQDGLYRLGVLNSTNPVPIRD